MEIARPSDFNKIKEYGMEFIKSTSHISKFYTEVYVDKLINDMLQAPKQTDIILLDEGGMLMGKAVPFLYGPHIMATEIAWYVTPEARGKGIGAKLLEGFEYWAKNIAGCSIISMGSIDDKVGEYFKKQGYELSERAYVKEL